MLSDKLVQEFKDIFKKEYGKELTKAEAREQGQKLVDFFEILMKIDKQNKEISSKK